MVGISRTKHLLKFLLTFYFSIHTNAFTFKKWLNPQQLFCYGNPICSSQLHRRQKNRQNKKKSHYNRAESRLYGIDEWRDTIFDIPGFNEIREDGIPREVTVLPFPYQDVLLQGETKQLRLYEDRFIQLFEECMEKHNGVVAMGLIADSGIIQTVPLCEVEAYNRMEGFGIFVTIRVVGRGSLLDLTKQEPYIKGVCVEVIDNTPPNLDIPNLIAGNIENFMVNLSSLEHQIKKSGGMGPLSEMDKVKDEEMRRRIVEARLEDTFYNDDEDDDNDDGDDDEFLDRNAQFNVAFKQAKACDTQGYMISSVGEEDERSAQDLTAISWAVFCTEDVEDTVRVQALDCDDLLDRLKMGSYMLREKKAELEAKVALITKDDDEEE